MSDPPLIPAPLYGIRTWRVTSDAGGERLEGSARATAWPAGGEWLHARCDRIPHHAAPQAGCECGIHAWHPRRSSARALLASRREIPGVVEAAGAVEVHDDGFRAERGRPYALVLAPGRNAKLIARLAAAYRAEVVEVRDADALLAWCAHRGLGLDERTVVALLGSDRAAASRRARRGRIRLDALRLVLALVLCAVLALLGSVLLTDPPGPRVLHGRTGEVHVP